VCKAIVNEDPNAKVHTFILGMCTSILYTVLMMEYVITMLLSLQLIRDLKDEISKLRGFIRAEGLEGKVSALGTVC